MKLKRVDYVLIGICVLAITISFLLLNNNGNKNEEKENIEVNKVRLLNDYSRFFTVESSLYKFINYIQMKDTESLLKILDDEYEKSNNVTALNVLEFLGYLNGSYTFKAKKIYYENIDENVTKYYVYGIVLEDIMDKYVKDGIDKYYEVTFDTSNKTYSVAPYFGDIFKEEQ